MYTPDDKRIPAELKRMQRSIADSQRATGTERERSLLRLQEQVEELVARSVTTLEPADLDISADTPSMFPTATRAFTFPAPQLSGRVATLTLAADVLRTTSSGNITLWIELLQANVVTWRRTGAMFIGDANSAPPGWASTQYLNDTIQIAVPSEAEASMQLRLYAHTFVAGTVTARMQNIRATLEYGARI
ncbi:hypothetical protein MUN78_06920 [Leucobacter allii]|uniref:Uncharacterized protein n=1 Tax=Leucobacter allii TaxID=2932247 RepID=A0ABY4FQI0_9MICO|nr:hypothetical protein [Leucobacter allii]UOQ58548.1 hypothetical protein MUN78_06920 [Leucobacter allii]